MYDLNLRLKEIDDCITLNDFLENCFPKRMDEFSGSNSAKREMLEKWITQFKNGNLDKVYKSRTIKQMVEDIYKPFWDDETGLFQGLRKHSIKWIENYCNN